MKQSLLARLCLLWVSLLASSTLLADTLWLSNGDKLSGELVKVLDGEITWRHPLLGELKISQLNISYMETHDGYSLQVGSRAAMKNCAMVKEEDRQLIRCDGQPEHHLRAWQTLSQVSVGELEDKTAYKLTGSVTLTVEDSSGNNVEQSLGVDVRTELRNDKHRHNLNVDIDTKEVNGVQTKEQHTYSYKYDRFVTDQWYWTGNSRYERDDFKELEVRSSAGAGLGYQVIDNEFASLAFEGGLSYILEEFTDGSDNDKGAIRLTTDFNWQLAGSGLSFFHRNLFWQTFQDGDDWEFESETGFLWPIYGSLSSEIKYELDYDNFPAEEDKKTDRVWTIGVRYDW